MKVLCPSCGRVSATARAPHKYHYKESGMPNLWLIGGVTLTDCEACGEEHLRIEKESQLLQLITLTLLMDARPLTGYELRFLRGACRLSQAALAKELRLARRETIAERESRENPGIPFAEEMFIRQILLTHFDEQLAIEGNNFLASRHRRQLERFRTFFMEFSKQFVEKFVARPKLVVSMDDRRELWEIHQKAA